MAIRKSSSSGTPFGDTASRPASPLVGQTYYNGTLGYLEIYTSTGWIPATGANDLNINLAGPNTAVTFPQTYSSGSYSIVSLSNDTSLDIYAYALDGSLAGYSNTKSFIASQRFNKMVVLGGTSGDVLSFSYKTTYTTSTSTTDVNAGPYITSVSPSGMANINDTVTVAGGNFASNVAVHFTGTGYSSTAAKSIVRSSSTQLIVTRPDNFPSSASPYTITVTNPSVQNQPTGSAVHQYSPITAGVVPVWSSNATVTASAGFPLTALSATDSDGSSSVSYSVASGALPTGVTSVNSSTGAFVGVPSAAGTYSFVVRATDSGANYTDRSFTYTITGANFSSDSTYFYHKFNSSGTFSPTINVTVDYLILGAGGGSSGGTSGTWYGPGGAGGVVRSGNATINAGSYPVVIGSGGAGSNPTNGGTGGNGTSSSFNSITATGGNGGGPGPAGASNADYSGASTGDGRFASAGGGAGAGGNASSINGGIGVVSSISGTSTGYGGGGAGGTDGDGSAVHGGGNATNGRVGQTNLGGGASGSSAGSSFAGGSGVVVIRYTKASVGG